MRSKQRPFSARTFRAAAAATTATTIATAVTEQVQQTTPLSPSTSWCTAAAVAAAFDGRYHHFAWYDEQRALELDIPFADVWTTSFPGRFRRLLRTLRIHMIDVEIVKLDPERQRQLGELSALQDVVDRVRSSLYEFMLLAPTSVEAEEAAEELGQTVAEARAAAEAEVKEKMAAAKRE